MTAKIQKKSIKNQSELLKNPALENIKKSLEGRLAKFIGFDIDNKELVFDVYTFDRKF